MPPVCREKNKKKKIIPGGSCAYNICGGTPGTHASRGVIHDDRFFVPMTCGRHLQYLEPTAENTEIRGTTSVVCSRGSAYCLYCRILQHQPVEKYERLSASSPY